MEDRPRGVLLLNLGGPDSLSAVRPFLFNLFSDRDIIRLGPALLQKPVAGMISLMRAPKTRSLYKLIGGGSPINEITRAQADALQESLEPHGNYRVYFGMRYWHPFIRDALEKMYDDGIRNMTALSLYPHNSVATTGSAYSEVKRCLKKYDIEPVFAGPWYNNPDYITALYNLIIESIDKNEKYRVILYSAHSLPESFIAGGDPYKEHIEATIGLLNARLAENGYLIESYLAFQSRSGPVKWLEPSTGDMIKELGEKGVRDLTVVPISFVSDHIETLYEIDILYKGLASTHGINLKRTRSLNTDPLFIKALKNIVLNYN
ncbi:ferrochelatase [bacterium BMS3Abin07]|nr:ferrochelatase [bacterium BMS3Abin07]GBE31778.1 ferrochelatase [bacterium BMS3Bbin05]HDL20104.1 ferrochelatase [Nitrospirota bacterium]HDO22207.1 ferrochelatase [Nitrospirota bacterium]HDZ88621.1 ferrochelatase [Nitrospirota bacterium]